MSALPPKADVDSSGFGCPLCAKSGHTLKTADCGHNKLWRECQIALLRYGLVYSGKDCFKIGMTDLPAAPGVFRHQFRVCNSIPEKCERGGSWRSGHCTSM